MIRLWIMTISTLLMCSNTVFADSHPLALGIFPYASTSKLITHHKNIQKHINKADKFNISLVTAKNVSTYITNLANYKYDLIYSPPHVARFAEKKYGY